MKDKSIIITIALAATIGISLHICSKKEIHLNSSKENKGQQAKISLKGLDISKIIEDGLTPTTIRNSELKSTLEGEFDQIDNLIKYQGIESELANDNLETGVRTQYLALLEKRQNVFNELVRLQLEETRNLLNEGM